MQFRRFPIFRLLLACVVGGLWARSHGHSEILTIFLNHGTAQGLISDRGRMVIYASNVRLGDRRAYTYDLWQMTNEEFADIRRRIFDSSPRPVPLVGTLLGRSGKDAFTLPGASYHFIAIPFWMLSLFAGVPLVIGLRTFWHRRRWGTAGVCGQCGYDLRASSERCPECGARIAESAATQALQGADARS